MTKDVRKLKTERDIQHAMLQLLTTKNFRQMTVADICQASLTSRSTFYAHYLDKYDLLDQLVAKYQLIFTQKVHLRFEQMIAGEIDALVKGLLADMADNREAIRILFTVHEPAADLEAGFHDQLLAEWQRFIQEKSPTMTAPAELIAAMGTNVQMTVIEWALTHGDTSIDVVADAVNTIRGAVLRQIN
ncbi:hypothetical protein [Lactobacillus pentosus] [Lactiplantibacillus mudanjiangensis]|uniref:TetR/AcrR family transcriptional regulator n=1 Tax=Lactiplantibacillus mudanjiangensis TaxID=1296538 RepID=UPI0010148700|nr:hypothetical protein [Lactobacillus pentosus] [Lactiplantibacillus mudanjiangensis]